VGWPWCDGYRLINGAGEGGQVSPSPNPDHNVLDLPELAHMDSDQWVDRDCLKRVIFDRDEPSRGSRHVG
jgi:hypothetical protein